MNLKLETDRLYLRPFAMEDASCFYEMNDDEQVMRYTGDVPFKNLDAAKEFVKKYNEDPESQYQKYQMGRLTMVRKTDDKALGWSGLKYHPNEDVVDLGYRLKRKYWNKGYATEAAKRCLQHAFEDHQLKEVIANVHEKTQLHKSLQNAAK
ncbi:MAG: GNAT family N-acetyltransferase [Nonlabens sp.]